MTTKPPLSAWAKEVAQFAAQASLRNQLPKLFHCAPARNGISITTPLIADDGTLIQVFMEPSDPGVRLTDYGETLGQLELRHPHLASNPNYPAAVAEIIKGLSLENNDGCIELASPDPEELAGDVIRLAQGILQLSSLGQLIPHQRE